MYVPVFVPLPSAADGDALAAAKLSSRKPLVSAMLLLGRSRRETPALRPGQGDVGRGDALDAVDQKPDRQAVLIELQPICGTDDDRLAEGRASWRRRRRRRSSSD